MFFMFLNSQVNVFYNYGQYHSLHDRRKRSPDGATTG